MAGKGPLGRIRILDLSTMIAGPWAAGILADQGAEVIKIEEPRRGDMMRYLGTRKGDISTAFQMANRGKRSVAIDLKTEEGIEKLLGLARHTDVLLHNFRPGVMDRLGLGYEALRAVRDDIIYASISGFGETGPLSRMGAYDPVMQAFCGLAAVQGGAAGPPQLQRTIVCDKVTSLIAAQAISAALFARERGGGGQEVHVSMLAASAAFAWLELCEDESFLDSQVDIRPATTAGYRLYRFADGWAAIAPASDATFLAMLRAFAVGEADDPRIATFAARQEHVRAAARAGATFERKIAKVPLTEGIARLQAADVPCAPVQSLAELAAHPQSVAAGIFTETDYWGVGRVREVTPPARFSRTPAGIAGRAPSLGEHTEEFAGETDEKTSHA